MQQNNKRTKTRYCKKCASPIDNTTKNCTGCGKRYFRAKVILPIVFLSLLVIAFAGLNIFQYMQNQKITAEYEELETKYKEVETDFNNTIADLRKISGEAVGMRSFLKSVAIIIDGQDTYHRYGCYILTATKETSNCQICSAVEAIYDCFTACPYCH